MTAPSCDLLDEYLDDELDQVSEQRFRYHLVDCVSCQSRLHERMQLIAALDLESGREAAAPARPKPRPERPAPRRRYVGIVTGAAALFCLAAALLVAVDPSRHQVPERAASGDAADRYLAALAARRSEAWIGRETRDGIGRHLPYSTPMAAGANGYVVPDEVLSALEKRRDWLTLAVLRTWERDVAAAERALAHLRADDPYARNVRATLQRMRHRADLALDQLDGLEGTAQPDLPARWNRALVLSDLGFDLSAAEAFEDVADSKSPGAAGWSDDARRKADLLGQAVRQRYERAYKAEKAAETMLDDGVPMPAATVRDSPGLSRHFLYHAINAAPSAARVLALLPVAEELDRQAGGTAVLRTLVKRASEANFSLRAPLAARYRAVRESSKEPAAALFDASQRGGDALFRIGVLSLAPSPLPQRLVDEFERLADALDDPWWRVRAREVRAQRLIADEDLAGAQVHLALDDCPRGVEYRCAALSRLLVATDRQLRRPELAMRLAREGWTAARSDGTWSMETFFLEELAATGRQLPTATVAMAANHELDLRNALEQRVRDDSPEASAAGLAARRSNGKRSCHVERFRHQNAALTEIERLHVEPARAHLEAITCEDKTSWLVTAELLAAVHSMAPGGSEGRRALDLVARNARDLSPADEMTVEVVAGRIALESNRDEGARHLQRVLELAATGTDHERDRFDTRSDSYGLLIHAAARAAEWGEALRLFADEQKPGTAAPARCTVALSQDLDRLSVVVRDSEGRDSGHLEQGFKGELRAEQLAQWGLLDGFDRCEQVDVLARPPLVGRPGVMPHDLPWRYRTSVATAASAPANPPRPLIIAGVRPPAGIELPELAPWGFLASPVGTGATLLTGLEANPQRVLAALRNATEVLVQAHGIVDAEVSNVSYLALSPDSRGSYALTAGQIRGARLDGHPIVFLAACRAAQPGPYRREPWSLPLAFLQAGARAVFAATGELKSSEAERFFETLTKGVRQGYAPAVALRDARREALLANPGTTLRDVMLFQ